MIKNKLIKFGATWCAPCKSASKFLSKYNPDTYLEVDITENGELAEKFGIKNIPTFVLVNINGDEVNRFTGFNPKLIEESISKIKS